MTDFRISKDTSIEELVDKKPSSVKYLLQQGLACIVCGEPVWGTIETLAKAKGFSDDDIERFVNELRGVQ
jgi:hypothetical protein